MNQRFADLAQEFTQQEDGSELLIRSLLLEILVHFTRNHPKPESTEVQQNDPILWGALEKALNFVHGHYAEEIYVNQLATVAGINIARLQETFQAVLAMNSMQYLQWYRLTRAQAQLSAPGARVAHVALEVGFETLSHFNASFRKWFGVSPTEYVRQSRDRGRFQEAAGLAKPRTSAIPDYIGGADSNFVAGPVRSLEPHLLLA